MKKVKVTQYVMPICNGWMVKASNRVKFSLLADNKKDAVAFARRIAETTKSDLVIYSKKMQILSRISYGSMAKA